VNISIFGPLQVICGDRVVGPRDFPGLKPKQLLEILVVERGHTVSKGRLVDLLWTERLPQNYLATLETYVSVLRQTLEPGVRPRDSHILTEHGGYRLDSSRVTVDLDEFDEKLREASVSDPVRALSLFESARKIPRGEPFEDEPYADWAVPAREAYTLRRVQALIDAGRLALLTGEANAAFNYAEEAVALNPLAEAAYQILMTAAYSTWRQEVALQAFDRCRRILADELGVDPLDETVALHMAILRHEDAASLRTRLAPLELAAPRPAIVEPASTQPADTEPASTELASTELASTEPAEATTVEPAGQQTRLVGRQVELRCLENAARTALNGQFSLLLVVGEPGMGKTTIADALAARLDVNTGFNRCSDLESKLPYAALSFALRPVLGPCSQDTIPLLGDLLRRNEAQPFDELARLATMEGLALELLGTKPFLLVLDDAQWADDETIMTLSYLRRRIPTTPIAVVLTCSRLALRREALRNLQVDARIDLDLLSPQELAALEDPEVLTATSGHPAFVAAWLEARENHLAEAFTPAVRDRVVRRCWDLGPTAYRLLTVASALDQPVQPGQLASLVGASIDDIAGDLDDLVEQRVLTAQADGFRFRVAPERAILNETMSAVRRDLLRKRSRECEPESHTRRFDDDRSFRADPVPLQSAPRVVFARN
jgi:DNA-binding SARP family transcriptional activator